MRVACLFLTGLVLVGGLSTNKKPQKPRHKSRNVPEPIPQLTRELCWKCSTFEDRNGPQLYNPDSGEWVTGSIETCQTECTNREICLEEIVTDEKIRHNYCGPPGLLCNKDVDSSCASHIVRLSMGNAVLTQSPPRAVTDTNKVKTSPVEDVTEQGTEVGLNLGGSSSAPPSGTPSHTGPLTNVYPASGCPLCQNPLLSMPESCAEDPNQRGACEPGSNCLMVPFMNGLTYDFFGVQRKAAYLCYERAKVIEQCLRTNSRWNNMIVNCAEMKSSDDVGPTLTPQQATTSSHNMTSSPNNEVDNMEVLGATISNNNTMGNNNSTGNNSSSVTVLISWALFCGSILLQSW